MKLTGEDNLAIGLSVASCVEAWIEIIRAAAIIIFGIVASCVEAWIEITKLQTKDGQELCRLLRGGVD